MFRTYLWYWVWIAETYFSFVVPTFHVVTMMPLMAKSTGMIWAKSSALQCMLRITPLPPPTSSPMGPLRLSTHPATGSFTDGVTAITFHISSACRGSRPCRHLPAARWVRWGCPLTLLQTLSLTGSLQWHFILVVHAAKQIYLQTKKFCASHGGQPPHPPPENWVRLSA